MTIHLNNLQFFSFHGIHPEEKILGNEFEVNIEITINQPGKIDSIHQTVNYVTVYELVKKQMTIPTQLLETLAQEITEQIHLLDNRIQSISFSIKKLHPPIVNFEGSVGVSFKKEY